MYRHFIVKSMLVLTLVIGSLFYVGVEMAEAATWVNGYTRSDGTAVRGHYRSTADGSPYNNWSYPGNTNPYTGVTAGGNTSTYLNNYYDRSSPNSLPSIDYSSLYDSPRSSSYTPTYTRSYSSSYTPRYESSYVGSGLDADDVYTEVSNGWKSYGILNCDAGYYPKNNRCAQDPRNGYTIGSTIYCDSGYKREGDRCTQPRNGSYRFLGGIVCDAGYRKVESRCVKDTHELQCARAFGEHARPALGTDSSCICAAGYQWSAAGDSCSKIPDKPTQQIKSYVQMVGDSSVLSCTDMGWVNPQDVQDCLFYKQNQSDYIWTVR